MMLAGPRLRVTVATTHVPLKDVPRLLTADGIASTIWLTAEGLARRFGIAAPRVAVAGLNPHAGEAGRFGDEEDRLVRPAIDRGARPDRRGRPRRYSRRSAGPRLGLSPGRGRQLRRRRRALSRPGPDPAQAAPLRRRREPDAGAALRPHLARSRNGLRHRRHRPGARAELPGGVRPRGARWRRALVKVIRPLEGDHAAGVLGE